jgi:hypothetical protein
MAAARVVGAVALVRCEAMPKRLRWREPQTSREECVMIRVGIAVAAAALCLGGLTIGRPATMPALAAEAPPDTAGGRYMFEKQANRQDSGQGSGYVRLDTQTGEVALCSQRAVGFACEAAPDDRTVFENEIVRLRTENATLKKDILSHGLPLPPGINPEPGLQPAAAENSAPPVDRPGLRLPDHAAIGRMVALADRVWHRLVEALERARDRVFNKS